MRFSFSSFLLGIKLFFFCKSKISLLFSTMDLNGTWRHSRKWNRDNWLVIVLLLPMYYCAIAQSIFFRMIRILLVFSEGGGSHRLYCFNIFSSICSWLLSKANYVNVFLCNSICQDLRLVFPIRFPPSQPRGRVPKLYWTGNRRIPAVQISLFERPLLVNLQIFYP